jgi:hypothetical protein
MVALCEFWEQLILTADAENENDLPLIQWTLN